MITKEEFCALIVDYEGITMDIARLYNQIYVQENKILSDPYKKDEFDDHSVHIIARNENNEIVSYLRIIKPILNKLPAFELVMPNNITSIKNCVEFSRFLIRSDVRVTSLLYSKMLEVAVSWVIFSEYSTLIADVFKGKNNDTYDLFVKNGFSAISSPYNDTRFINCTCQVLAYDITDLKLTLRSDQNYLLNNRISLRRIFRSQRLLKGVGSKFNSF